MCLFKITCRDFRLQGVNLADLSHQLVSKLPALGFGPCSSGFKLGIHPSRRVGKRTNESPWSRALGKCFLIISDTLLVLGVVFSYSVSHNARMAFWLQLRGRMSRRTNESLWSWVLAKWSVGISDSLLRLYAYFWHNVPLIQGLLLASTQTHSGGEEASEPIKAFRVEDWQGDL
jgi:hypothetical protein